jgi:hypothetical protein
MCTPDKRDSWATSIGFVLRDYIPDQFDDVFAKQAQARLAQELPGIEALSEGELRGRLRVRVVSKRTGAEGLATCAKPVGGRLEARVVLEGSELAGLPQSARARLSEDDVTLFEQALASTLPIEAPALASGLATGPGARAWLCRPERLFGAAPYVLAGVGQALAWIPAVPEGAAWALADLASRSNESGPLKATLFAWDGAALSDVELVVHTILGPSTPEFTLRLPPATLAAMGLTAQPDGRIGLRRS